MPASLARARPAVLIADDSPITVEVTARIRARADGSAGVSIIALTSAARDRTRERCLRAGMDGYLRKPPSRDKLVAALERQVSVPPG